MFRGQGHFEGIQHCGIQIDRAHHGITRRARFDLPRPAHHQRHALSTFINPRLALTQRRIVRRSLATGPLPPLSDSRILRVVLRQVGNLVIVLPVAVHVAAIVGVKHEQGVLAQPQLIELVHQASETLVHTLQHRRHDRIPLLPTWIPLLRKLRRVRFLVSPWTMHAILPEVEEKRLILVRFHKLQRLVRQSIRDVLPIRSIGDVPHMVLPRWASFDRHAIRRKVTRWPRVRRATPSRLKAILVRAILRHQPQVPFAKVPRPIACIAQHLRQCHNAGINEILAVRVDQFGCGRCLLRIARCIRGSGRLMPRGRGDAMPSRVLPRQNGCSRRRTKRHCISIREPHRLLRQPRHVGRLIILRPIRLRIHPAHVIDDKEDHIGRSGEALEGNDRETQEQKSKLHGFHLNAGNDQFLRRLLLQIADLGPQLQASPTRHTHISHRR